MLLHWLDTQRCTLARCAEKLGISYGTLRDIIRRKSGTPTVVNQQRLAESELRIPLHYWGERLMRPYSRARVFKVTLPDTLGKVTIENAKVQKCTYRCRCACGALLYLSRTKLVRAARDKVYLRCNLCFGRKRHDRV